MIFVFWDFFNTRKFELKDAFTAYKCYRTLNFKACYNLNFELSWREWFWILRCSRCVDLNYETFKNCSVFVDILPITLLAMFRWIISNIGKFSDHSLQKIPFCSFDVYSSWYSHPLSSSSSSQHKARREYLHGIANWPMPALGWPARLQRLKSSRAFFARELANFKSTLVALLIEQKTRFAQSGLCAGKWHTWSSSVLCFTTTLVKNCEYLHSKTKNQIIYQFFRKCDLKQIIIKILHTLQVFSFLQFFIFLCWIILW